MGSSSGTRATGGKPDDCGEANDRAAALKREVWKEVRQLSQTMGEITAALKDNPELGGEEHDALDLYVGRLEACGFSVETGVANLPTAFVGIPRERVEPSAGIRLGFFIEYDALPKIGHGCGHNLSGAASFAACVALSRIVQRYDLPATCVAFGTPGEETISGKIPMLEAGLFDGLSAAMMVHAYDAWIIAPRCVGCWDEDFDFTGKSGHSSAPYDSINALDGAVIALTAINCLRQRLHPGDSISAVIVTKDLSQSIVPDEAMVKAIIRSHDRERLQELRAEVERCAEGAALATSCGLTAHPNPAGQIDSLVSDSCLCDLYKKNLRERVPSPPLDSATTGATDMGNVSHAVPTVHAMMASHSEGVAVHSKEFADATVSERALTAAEAAAYAMAATGVDLIVAHEVGPA